MANPLNLKRDFRNLSDRGRHSASLIVVKGDFVLTALCIRGSMFTVNKNNHGTSKSGGSEPTQTSKSENTASSSGGHEFANAAPTSPRSQRPVASDQVHRQKTYTTKSPDDIDSEEIHQASDSVPSVSGLHVPFSKILEDYKISLRDVAVIAEGPQNAEVTLQSIAAVIKRMGTLVSTVQTVIGRGKLPELDKFIKRLKINSLIIERLLSGSEREQPLGVKLIANILYGRANELRELSSKIDGYFKDIRSRWIAEDKKIGCLQVIGMALAVAGAALAAVAMTGLLVFAPPVGIAAGAAVAAIGAAFMIASSHLKGRMADKYNALKNLPSYIDSELMGEWPEAIRSKHISKLRSRDYPEYDQVIKKYDNGQELNRDDMRKLTSALSTWKGDELYREFPFTILRDANLAGVDLHGMDFNGIDFSGANFKGANLENARFNGVVMTFAELSGANLEGAMFHNVACTGAHLADANMKNVVMIKVDLGLAVLDRTDLTDAVFSKVNFDSRSMGYVTSSSAKMNACLQDGSEFASVLSNTIL